MNVLVKGCLRYEIIALSAQRTSEFLTNYKINI